MASRCALSTEKFELKMEAETFIGFGVEGKRVSAAPCAMPTNPVDD
jgi:hypothetical protein